MPKTSGSGTSVRLIAAQLPIGSPGAQFYLDLSEAGARSVAAEIKDDRPDDGREW